MLSTKVSIIIPYKEDRGWLDKAIESVEKQNFAGKIEIILSQSNGNVAYNLNRGIEKATGDYIKYLCDDDMLTDSCLHFSTHAMQDNDFIHGNAINFFSNGKRETYKPRLHYPTIDQMVKQNVIHGGTLMYKSNVFDRFGLFDESLNCAEEYDMNMKILSKGGKIGYCNAFLYQYRRHEEQKSLGKGIDQVERYKRIKLIQDRYGN